ncbi:MAG: hypothetical protein ACKVQA_21470 [Burkholderiales bacterium]
MRIATVKRNALKTIGVYSLFSWLPVVAFSAFSGPLPESGRPFHEALSAAASILYTPPLPVAAMSITQKEFSGSPALDSTREPNDVEEYLSAFVFLHRTWNESFFPPGTVALGVCTE